MSVFADLARLDADLKAVASTAVSAAAQVKTATADIGRSVRDATENGATALDDFIFLLRQKVEQGDDLAQLVLQFIGDVESGVRRADEAGRAFGGIVSNLTGETRSLGALLQDLLSGVEQTTRATRDGLAAVKDWRGALEELRSIHTQAAQNVVKIFEAFQKGQVTLDFLLRTINELRQKARPGDAVADLSQIIGNAARTGDLT